MRTFIAIEIPEKIKQEVISLKKNFSGDWTRVGWAREKTLHLTLLFLGEISEDSVATAKEKISLVTGKHKAFRMSLEGSGVFPNLKRPRVLWVGVCDRVKQPITNLYYDLANSLHFLKPDVRKRFTPHITFGRIKSIYNPTKLKKTIESISFETDEFLVDKIVFFNSVLKPTGAIHTPISTYPLQSM
jgi:2'-5' RNA ligase